MAGRGTDIVLGGSPEMLARQEAHPDENPDAYKEALARFRKVQAEEREVVVAAGGLHIVGTERHESRRIDNQLRGRSGRQGDPGSSRFYLSLEDELMRIFGGDRITNLMERLGMEEDVPIEHPWVTKAVENAQKKVEARNFDIRKHLLEYDDVLNQQRKTIYALRRAVLEGRYEGGAGAAGAEGEKSKAAARAIETDPKIAKRVAPILESMVKHFGSTGDGADAPYRDLPRSEIPLADLKTIDPEKLEREVYHYFGVRVPIEGAKDAPARALAELCDVVPRALTEQRERFVDLCDGVIGALVDQHCPENGSPEDWDFAALEDGLSAQFAMKFGGLKKVGGGREAIAQKVYADVERFLERREEEMTPELALRVFRHLYLEEIDKQWIDHLQNMDSLRDGIGLRGYGQKDPKLEYKKEGYNLFMEMLGNIESNVLSKHFRVKVAAETETKLPAHKERKMVEGRGAVGIAGGPPSASRSVATPPPSVTSAASARRAPPRPAQPVQKVETFRRDQPKVGRNDPCPCGSGKKYKRCHGAESGASPSD
jgi:preprotein translocase subunit SecA